MNKKALLPVVAIVALLVIGGTAVATLGSGTTSAEETTNQDVQGVVDDNGSDETSEKETSEASDPEATSTPSTTETTQSSNQTQQNTQTTSTQQSSNTNTAPTNNSSSNDSSDGSLSNDSNDDTSKPPITRGGGSDLEIVDVVPIDPGSDDDDDDGGPTLTPTPIRGGGISR